MPKEIELQDAIDAVTKRVQGREKNSIVCYLLLAWQTITDGVTAQTSKTREKYWKSGHIIEHSATY